MSTQPRLFTALWPPADALSALAGELAEERDWPPEGWRPIPTARWHVTVRFHGKAEPGVLARRLEARASGLAAPWLRLAGAVSLPRVASVAVHPFAESDAAALALLVRAAGGDPTDFGLHLAVARTARRDDAPPPAGPLARYRGPRWRPAEVCLVRSQPMSAGTRYTVLHRVPLTEGAGPATQPRPTEGAPATQPRPTEGVPASQTRPTQGSPVPGPRPGRDGNRRPGAELAGAGRRQRVDNAW
jgi:2'-5' RNA ligase